MEVALNTIGYKVGDHRILPVWVDSQSDPAKASGAYAEAVEGKGIQAGVLNWHSSVAIAVMDVAAMSVGFDFTAGFINIANFEYMAVAGVGGYTSALLVINTGLAPWFAMVAGGISSAVLGLIIGMISLRLRGIFAACLFWFFGLALMGLAIKMVWLTRGPWD